MAGDNVARRVIYDAYAAKVLAICRRYVTNLPEAEDILQESFIRIFEKIHLYNIEEGALDGWIYKVTVNAALQYLRKRQSLRYDFVEDNHTKLPSIWLPDELDLEDLKKMIDRLPDGQRVVFNLYLIEGYSHKEIAKMLEITENGSKSQLSRAKETLRRIYNEQNEIGESIK